MARRAAAAAGREESARSRRASSGRRLVILDRDGVINEDSAGYVKSPAEWRPLPGSLEAIADLCRAGFEVAVATNQAGIARGLLSEADLEAIHAHMREAVALAGGRLAGIYYCPHHPDEGCACRKPMPGLLEQAAADFGCSLEDVPFVGDKLTDVLAAEAAGARPIYVCSSLWSVDCDAAAARGAEIYPDLRRAADALLAE